MTNKDLVGKLNTLKSIAPDSTWLASNRELLLSQISNSGARELSAWQIFAINFSSLMKASAKPAYALGAFVLILITGSIFSHNVFSSAKPNDSLYIARIISEKAKLNTVLNTDDRNKLAVQFATEHAQDISDVLADPAFNNESNQDQVAKLNDSFNEEINNVKTHIAYLNTKSVKTNSTIDTGATLNASDTVTMANSLKDGSGVEVFVSGQATGSNPSTIKATTSPALKNAPDVLLVATSSDNLETVSTASSTDTILDEAKLLFDQKDYSKASDKLKEVDIIIKN
ncbi:MAG: hypothetical protein WC467_02090 [Patescibacteria group bacterium]